MTRAMTPFDSERESRSSESTRGKWRNQSLALDSGTLAERLAPDRLASRQRPATFVHVRLRW